MNASGQTFFFNQDTGRTWTGVMKCVCLEDIAQRTSSVSPSSSSSEDLSVLISLPPEALPREERRVREIAGVLTHHPRNIDCLITVALQPIINTMVVMEAEKEEWSRRQHCLVSKRGDRPLNIHLMIIV